MASFFDLASNPTDAIKSKSSGGSEPIDLTNFRPSNRKPIGNDWDVKPGDILSWSDYRASKTYFVTDQRRLRKNRDTSESGYLTIPLSITRLFPSALTHYGPILETESDLVSSIELSPTDGIFAEKLGSPLPETICNRTDISYSFNPMADTLFVTVGNNEGHEFPIDEIKTQDIVDYVNVANEKQVAFIVKYEIKGQEACNKWPQSSPSGLPAGWSREQHGGASYGNECLSGAWIFKGPEKTKEAAYKIAEKQYDGFGVEISWKTDEC